MKLLRFTARNHKSLRDEITLDLVNPKLIKIQPEPGISWKNYTYTVAGIFGANATGKSTILHAMRYALTAILSSSTRWQASPQYPIFPFRLNQNSQKANSEYEFEFLISDQRYRYSFSVNASGIQSENLDQLNTATSRWRNLFTRTANGTNYRGLPNPGQTTPKELVLSRAMLLRTEVLGPIAEELVYGIDFISPSQDERNKRIRQLANEFADRTILQDELSLLLKVADIGITDVEVQEEIIPEIILAAREKANAEMETAIRTARPDLQLPEGDSLNNGLDTVIRNLEFTHHGSNSEKFKLEDESDGTISWLTVAVPALKALRHGEILVIDEIDSSLHPHLAQLLMEIFANPEINSTGAQLIFTSHDITLITKAQSLHLDEEQIWFTEKDSDGATELFSLADFPKATKANYSKRYMEGRYGAVPLTSIATMRGLIEDDLEEVEKIA